MKRVLIIVFGSLFLLSACHNTHENCDHDQHHHCNHADHNSKMASQAKEAHDDDHHHYFEDDILCPPAKAKRRQC